MMYRNFAIATVIAAPLVVMGVQGILPNPPEPAPTQQMTTDAPPPVPMPFAPPVAPPSAATSAPEFGQPMAEAGKPMLAPGAGLPEASVAPSANISLSFAPGTAPPGSPNAE